MEQGSAEWFAARCGKVTASRVADVTAKLKSGGYGASRATYMGQLIAERLTGQPMDSFTNAAMQWGIDTEPEARSAYEFYRDVDVKEIGFLVHPEIDMSGASPDGLIGIVEEIFVFDTSGVEEGFCPVAEGLVEIKCPNTSTHIDTLLGKAIDKKYLLQMQWQMEVTGAGWCDFVSYDPRMPENMRLHVERVDADPSTQSMLRHEIEKFLDELENKVEALREKYG
jgi:putative phage-type endonuclease